MFVPLWACHALRVVSCAERYLNFPARLPIIPQSKKAPFKKVKMLLPTLG
jgi:hypothetical protein